MQYLNIQDLLIQQYTLIFLVIFTRNTKAITAVSVYQVALGARAAFGCVHSCAGSVSIKCDKGKKDPMIWRWRKATKKYRNNVVQLLMSVVLCHKLNIEEMTRWFRMLTSIANSKSEYIHWDSAECGTIFRTVCLRNPRRTLFNANRELDVLQSNNFLYICQNFETFVD